MLLYLIIVCENHVMNFLSPIRNQCYGWLHSFDLLMLWCQTTNSPILEVIRIDERQLSFDFVSFTDNNPLWPPFECMMYSGALQGFQYFFKSPTTSLLTCGTFYYNLNNFHEYLIQHSLKSGGTKDNFR